MKNTEDIAIIGIACRFPEADSPDQFWKNLTQGRESIEILSEEQLIEAGVTRREFESPGYVRSATPLKDVDKFDAKFFGVPKAEACLMDPQQRILLELTYEALEDAGAVVSAQKLDTGVYATGGGITRSYLYQIASRLYEGDSDTGSQLQLLNDKDFLATRISYKLNLKGPSLTVQTACSSSMVAVHLARVALLVGDIDIGVVAASCIRLPQNRGYNASDNMIFSDSGHCRTFSNDADGTIFGSGSGVVVLKRYEDAALAGDQIYALIKSTSINNDGAAKFGYTASSVPGQAKTMVKAIASAGISADQLSYIECHGTATKIGDPLEIKSLEKAFALDTDKNRFCHIGSVKPNIGHLEQSAGIAGLIKVALMLKHRKLVPTINFSEANPKLKLDQSPFKMALDYEDWKPAESSENVRYAGLNCLGVGGTNVFAVLGEAINIGFVKGRKKNHGGNSFLSDIEKDVICISAKNKEQLIEYIKRISFVSEQVSMTDIAYNVNISRSHLPIRYVSLVTDDTDPKSWSEKAIKYIQNQKADSNMSSPSEAFCYVCNPSFLVDDEHVSSLLSDERFKEFSKEYLRLMSMKELSSIFSIEQLFYLKFVKTLAFEAALYSQIKVWGMAVETIAGEGLGEYVMLLCNEEPIENWIQHFQEDVVNLASQVKEDEVVNLCAMSVTYLQAKAASKKINQFGKYLYRNHPEQIDNISLMDEKESLSRGSSVNNVWLFIEQVFRNAIDINWHEYYPINFCQRIPLPSYPFEKRRYWLGQD